MRVDPEKLHSKYAEASVLGSMIIKPGCIGKVMEKLGADDFFLPEHKDIFGAIVRVWGKNQAGALDGLLVRRELEKSRALQEAGGLDYYRQVVESVPTAENVLYYADIVLEARRYRQAVQVGEDYERLLQESPDVNTLVQKAQDLVLGLEAHDDEPGYHTFADCATAEAVSMFDTPETIPTGFRDIDGMVGGFGPGDMVIVAARPSMGKSALALDMALNMARAGKSIAFFTFEMVHGTLLQRAYGSFGKINIRAIKMGGDPSRRNEIYRAALELTELKIVIHEKADTPEKMLAFVRGWKKTHGVDVVFIDYLQLMSAGRRTESRQQEITTISRKLKRMALEERVPVIALSQLNREVESRTDHRPRLSDLRESGSLEQDADIVALLYREDYYRRKADANAEVDGVAEVHIAKNREGPTGIVKLVFLEDYVTFADMSFINEAAI